MSKILNMGFRQIDTSWEFFFYRDGDKSETTITDISNVQEELQSLILFVEMQKSPEEQAQAAADQKILDMLTIITEKTSDEDKLRMIEIYPAYLDGVEYSKDQAVPFVRYNGKLYKIIGATFTSQPDWTPDVAVSLFVEVLPPGTIGDFVQPTGAHDAYQIGDRVIFEGWIYCSIINNNTWSPSAYPQGWEKEREV